MIVTIITINVVIIYLETAVLRSELVMGNSHATLLNSLTTSFEQWWVGFGLKVSVRLKVLDPKWPR